MFRLYDYLASGNGYKVRLLLSRLELPFELIERDITRGETRTERFLQKNPNGRIPVLELPDGEHLWESNAILSFLADGTEFWPADRLERARVLQWMFFEQYSHEPYIAVARFLLTHTPASPERDAAMAEKLPRGYAALDVMERHLADRLWMVGGRCTVADIALYAYTHVAGEGGFELNRYPAIGQWLMRVAAQPGHVTIKQRRF